MKPRKWVLFAGIFVLLVIGALHLTIRILEKNRDLETLLVRGISPYVQGSFTVGKVKLGFFAVSLQNVGISVPLNSFSVRIQEIKIGFSLLRLIRYRDPGRSVGRIILVNPSVDLTLSPPQKTAGPVSWPDSFAVPAPSPVKVAMLRDLPVECLFVKKGTVNLIDSRGNVFSLADHLDGKISDTGKELLVRLNGKLAASRNNMAVDCSFSWTGGNHHVSVRLDKAHISRPFALKDVVVDAGTLSGNLEFSFPDTLTPASLQSNGWLTIDNGVCRLGKNGESTGTFSIRLSSAGSLVQLDSLRCRWRGIRLKSDGFFDYANTQGKVSIHADSIDADSLGMTGKKDTSGTRIGGKGSIDVVAVKEDERPAFRVRLTGNGFTFGDMPVSIRARGWVDGKQFRADSVAIHSKGLGLLAEGTLGFAEPFPYSAEYTIHVDTFPDTNLTGKLTATGTVTGDKRGPSAELTVETRKVTVAGIPIENSRIEVTCLNNRIVFKTKAKSAPITINGVISQLSSKNPHGECSYKIGSQQIITLLKRKYDTLDSILDSAVVQGSIRGWTDRFEATVFTRMHSRYARGGLNLNIDKSGRAVTWKLHPVDLKKDSTGIQFTCAGRWTADSITIDTLGAKGISGSGRIYTAAVPARIEARIKCNLGIEDIRPYFSHGLPIDSGQISGTAGISGPFDSLEIRSEAHVRNLAASGITGMQTDAVITVKGKALTVLPFVIRKDKQVIAMIDTLRTYPHLRLSGTFDDVDVGFFTASEGSDPKIKGKVSGSFRSGENGFPVQLAMNTSGVIYDRYSFRNIRMTGLIGENAINLTECTGVSDPGVNVMAKGMIPWSFLTDEPGDNDTLSASITANGDMLAWIDKNIEGPVGGQGTGTIRASLIATSSGWRITKGTAELPAGTLTVRPFVLDDIKDFVFSMKVDEAQNVHTRMSGNIRRHPIIVTSLHQIPPGFEPLKIGNLSLGILQVETPKGGIDIHLPGFMDIGERGVVEFIGKRPFTRFALSGPVDKLRITGVWILRDMEFTFPFLNTHECPWEFDPFPYVTWDLDLKTGNRKVMYFWDLAGKHRRLLRFVEGYLDASSLFKVRGRDMDKTFALHGTIRSYKGSVYYGKVFDRNFDVGVEFMPKLLSGGRGYDNMPVLWGSAEAFADSSRLDRIKLTLLVHDPVTGSVTERGRLVDAPTPNFTFHLSSDYEITPGESERDFYKQAGLQFTSPEGAGSFVSDFGEQYLHRYLLQRLEKRLARSIGLDVFSIESSIASNYFNKLYNRQFAGLVNQDDLLALANVGVTVGRYFFRDYLFLKARGELIPIDTVLTPEYSIGLELQPTRYLSMDFNYGIRKGETSIEVEPRLNLQLRLPITRVRNFFNF